MTAEQLQTKIFKQSVMKKLKDRNLQFIEGKPILVKLTLGEFKTLFSSKEMADRMAAMLTEPGVDHVVVFVNDNEKSPHRGSKTSVKVGPTQKIRTLDDCAGRFIGNEQDGTSQVALFYISKAG